jgi:hypothetical protein
MKRGVPLLISIILMFVVVSASLADDAVQNLESRVVASFDNPEEQRWTVRGSKFLAEGFPLVAYPPSWPEAIYGRNNSGLDLRVLGAKAAFDEQGYNYLEFFTVRENQAGELEPAPIELPGRVREIDIWVWGSNYDYYLEAHLRDYTGRIHVLQLGDIRFVGWKNLSAAIPSYIPQSGGYITEGGFIKQLELEKIVLWTKPTENVAGFNVYLDQIKVLTDTFVTRFDGDDLADPDKVQEIWSNAEGM